MIESVSLRFLNGVPRMNLVPQKRLTISIRSVHWTKIWVTSCMARCQERTARCLKAWAITSFWVPMKILKSIWGTSVGKRCSGRQWRLVRNLPLSKRLKCVGPALCPSYLKRMLYKERWTMPHQRTSIIRRASVAQFPVWLSGSNRFTR